jgi:hypothetical protein
MRSAADVAKMRGISVGELFGRDAEASGTEVENG